MRPLLDKEHIAPEALRAMESFGASVIAEVRSSIEKDAVVVVGMAQNPHVRNVRKALRDAAVEFTYLEYGSYLSQWRKRLAIKLWTGWPTFPQVFVKGTLFGGETITVAALRDGSLKARLV
jgi:glutaredoxin-related protein